MSSCPTSRSSSPRTASRFALTAIVLDVRAGDASLALAAVRGALEGRGIRPQVFFLEARDEILIRRFSETRHRHPLDDTRGIASSIAHERALLDGVRQESDVVIDTSELSLRQLREKLFAHLGDVPEEGRIAIQLISFGYKHGIPLEADLVFDVRFMQNPYYLAGAATVLRADRACPRLRPEPAHRAGVPRPPRGLPRPARAGLHQRGQDPPHHRHRLHRRLPPVDRA